MKWFHLFEPKVEILFDFRLYLAYFLPLLKQVTMLLNLNWTRVLTNYFHNNINFFCVYHLAGSEHRFGNAIGHIPNTSTRKKKCAQRILMTVPEEHFKMHSTNVVLNQGYHVKNILTAFNIIGQTTLLNFDNGVFK